jgi:3-phosphoshikimate 1-carboxyvinyltransferase
VLLDAGTSSQFASSILMAATRARGEVVVELTDLTSASYLDLTVAAMSQFGAHTEPLDSHRLRVCPTAMTGGRYSVEPDFSAAAYPAVAALLTGGSVMLEGLTASSKQGDLEFLELVGRIGADVEWTGEGVLVSGRSEISGIEVDLSAMPDQVPTLAALAPFAQGITRICNVAHLRYKESDRLDAMCQELTRLGADVEERKDGLVIVGTWAKQAPPATNVRVRTYGDHRIAMSLALVGLRRPGVEVSEPEVVAKSYPAFWRDLESLIAK